MGSINYGNQILTFDFKQPATSESFNRITHQLLGHGIYSGGLLTKVDNSTITLSPLVCYIKDKLGGNLSVRIETTIDTTITVNPSIPYIVLRFEWYNTDYNYMDILAVAEADVLDTDLIVGKCLYDGSILQTEFDYYKRSVIPIAYEEIREEYHITNTDDITITLPDVQTDRNKRIYKKTGTGTGKVLFATTNNQTINGLNASEWSLNNDGDIIILLPDIVKNNWRVEYFSQYLYIPEGNLRIDDNGYIGINSDTDLLQLSSNNLIVNGNLRIDDDSYIGIDSDTDLLQLKNQNLVLNGSITVPVEWFYHQDGKYGINLQNSDIIGANAIYWQDTSDGIWEGLLFPKVSSPDRTNENDWASLRYATNYSHDAWEIRPGVLKLTGNQTIRADDRIGLLSDDAGSAQGLKIGDLVVSDAYADSSYIPTNGIYSKGGLRINNDAYIGIRSDTDLLQLKNKQLILNGIMCTVDSRNSTGNVEDAALMIVKNTCNDSSSVGIYGCSAYAHGVYGYANCKYGVYGYANCYCGVYGHANCKYGVFGYANCYCGVFGRANCNNGVFGYANCYYGVQGHAYHCYGVYGQAGVSRPVAGNGAYYNSSSSRYMKYPIEDICISNCLKEKPLKIYKWKWEDSNQRGMDSFVAPFAQDFQKTFNLTDDDEGYYEMGGLALGLGIELLQDIEILKKKIKKLEAKVYGN